MIRRTLTIGILAGVVVLTVGLWLWSRQPSVQPPLPDLAGADVEVVEAITQASDEVRHRPRSGPAWGHLGMVLSVHNFLREANAALTEAERLDPQEPRWPYLHGGNLILSDPAAASVYLEQAVQRCGDEVAPRLRLAEVLLDLGRFEEAEQYLKQALSLEPENLRTQLDLGRLALLREDWPGALEHLTACRGDEHCRKLARKLTAHVYRRQGQRTQAEAEEAQAAQLPDDVAWPDPYADEALALQCGVQAQIEKADALSRQGKIEAAIELLQETANRHPSSVQLWLGLGSLWFQKGDTAQAEQAFRKAVEADPRTAEGWFRLGCIQALDRPQEAAASFRRAIDLKPDHALAHFNLGHRLKQLGDRDGAAKEFRETLRCRPDYGPAREALEGLERSTKKS
jgi:tetratricopeptide (TPR) repeat protein